MSYLPGEASGPITRFGQVSSSLASKSPGRERAGKILFLGRDLVGGGVERFLRTILGVVVDFGYEPVLALLRETDIPDDCRPYRRHNLGKRRAWDNIGAIARLARVIDEERPDVVFSVDTPLSWRTSEAIRFARHTPVPIARVASNPFRSETGWRHLWARRAYRTTAVFVANSRGLARGFLSRYPRLQGRVRVCYNPTDFQRIRTLAREKAPENAPASFGLVAVGRLSREKRYDLMIRAIAETSRHLDVTLNICGDGPERPAIEARIAALGLEGRVRLLGHQENPYPWMAAADGILLTSDYEGLPNVLVEAQCLGRPIVATDCPYGVDEVVEDGETGFLARTGDVPGISAAILRLATDRDLAARLGKEGKARAEVRFSLQAASNAYRVLFEDALDLATVGEAK